ncbi:MAG TPA: CHAT domain-containing protein, partial [Gemmatimonadaceae bacterium]|nr:CHAT domain-containing protein [Gemmatimonadaceae bacterium]
ATIGLDAAIATLDSARPLMTGAPLELRSEYMRRRAVMRIVTGDPQAVATIDSAIDLAHRSGFADVIAYATKTKALHVELGGHHEEAIALHVVAESLATRAGDRALHAELLIRHTGLLQLVGRYEQAHRLMRTSLDEALAAHNQLAIGGSYTALGIFALRTGDLANAAPNFRRALDTYTGAGDEMSAALARYYLGLAAMAAGDTAAARTAIEQSSLQRKRVGDFAQHFEEQRTLAVLEMRLRNWDAAQRILVAQRPIGRQLGAGAAAGLRHDEAVVALGRGDLGTADRLLRATIAVLDTSDHLMLHAARLERAEVLARRGDLDSAEALVGVAEDALAAWRSSLSERELRIRAFEANATERSDQGFRIARLVNLLATSNRVTAAFALAERRRARELADQLYRAAALGSGDRSSARAAVAPAADAVVAALPDERTALLQYAVGRYGAPTTLFVLSKQGIAARTLPAEDSLVAPVGRFVSLLEGGRDPRDLARALGASMLDSAAALLPAGVNRVIIVPDGVIHRVPFDALLLPDGRRAVERWSISLAPSSSVMLALWARPARETRRRARILAMGDPVFGGEDAVSPAASDYRSAFAASGGLPRLVESGREAKLVGRYGDDSEVRLRERASATYLKHASLDSFTVIHLATHALVDDASIARTALALAPSDSEPGFVAATELASLKLGADLVTLSACRSASGPIIGGEGVQGLTAPLLQAGARAVVATDWRIGDRATVGFVTDFYGGLATGLPVTDALRDAKLKAIRAGAPPSVWAAFTVVGDPLVTVPLESPSNGGAWGWLAGLAAVGVGVAAATASRRKAAA